MTASRSVTVGLPVYNDPVGLRRTVPTVFSQTWDGEIRLLIVDDGSDEETVAVIDELAATYDGIEVVRNEVNRGRPHVRNQVLEHAGDGYLTWVDAGDLFHPRKLEVQIATLEEAADEHDGPLMCTCSIRRYFLDKDNERIRHSDVDEDEDEGEDQLYKVLSGKLYPYLPTMLAPVETFRAVGRFDERLLRRQDYDFIVRYIAEGGRVVSTPRDLPLFTYVKEDAGSSARKVARASHIIRKKHRALYRRYGRSFAWEMRQKQHLLAARFHDHNDERIRAGAYKALATIAYPQRLEEAAGPVGRGLRAGRRQAARLVRVVSRWLLGMLPLLRRLGIPALAKKLGVKQLAARLGMTRVFYTEMDRASSAGELPARPAGGADLGASGDEQQPTVDPRVWSGLSSARQAVKDDRLDDAIAELEQLIETVDDGTDAALWLLLEKAYRRQRRLHTAQQVLEQGIERHPEDRRLHARLVELLGLRREWAACVERWTGLVAGGHDDLGKRCWSRVARSYRELGEHERALQVAVEGLVHFPDDSPIRAEFYRNRSALVDWPAAIRGTADMRGPFDPDDPVGEVTEPGFLHGGDDPMVGWVRTEGDRPPRVSLRLNGRPIATTYATPSGDGRMRFSLNARTVRRYLGDGDVLAVTSDDRPVAMPDGGLRSVIIVGYDSRAERLGEKLDDDHVFTKFGHLKPGNTPERKAAIISLFEDVSALVDREFGLRLYPFYGNLLGAIREHDFIAHDVGGFDIGYISRFHEAGDVRREYRSICELLAKHDYDLRLEPWSTYVRAPGDRKVFLDLNFGWFTDAGELQLSFGWRGDPVTDRARLDAPRDAPMGLHLVPVPGNAEAVLDQMYGPTWAIPEQGFVSDAGLVRDTSYLLHREEMTELWESDPDRFTIWSVLTDEGEVIRVG